MKYLYQTSRDSVRILNLDAKSILGHVSLSAEEHRVRDVEGNNVANVRSIDDAIPILLDHYEKNARWQCETEKEYFKWTQFGLLEVKQDKLGSSWSAYRNCDYPLLHDGEPAIFATLEEAQRAADAHVGDILPDFKAKKDGLEWLPMDRRH
jgi:hypothetical protein